MIYVPVSTSAVSIVPAEVGRVGENLAAFYLGMRGFSASIVDRRGSDIWCQAPSGQLFSVEVKTATKPYDLKVGKYSYPYYSYHLQNKKADQFILVSLETNLCRVFSKDELDKRWSRTCAMVPAKEFTPEAMAEDFKTLTKSYQ